MPGVSAVRHTRSAVATVDTLTNMNLLYIQVFVLLAAAVCASDIEKRDADIPLLNKHYRYQRSAEPEAEPTYPRYYVPSYPHLNLYRHVRSAEPEAEPTYPRYNVPSYP
ncbi:uncharacterized protein [Cherax quadricarinatus]|uniref:uncharacterized protein n=1 Tax=Cherax quadricarinatus TaxID=27406 RepID=UPI00387E8A6E